MIRTAPLHEVFLCLLSPRAAELAGIIGSLDDGDWTTLMKWTAMHRVGPLLHWSLTRYRLTDKIPARWLSELSRNRQSATLRHLEMVGELVSLHRLLAAENIPHQALKGSYLASFNYPEAGMRPCRDIDILVPKEQAVASLRVLEKNGWRVRPEANEQNLELIKHFPGLISPSGRTALEIHVRLLSPGSGTAPREDLSYTPGYWERSVSERMAGEDIAFPHPTDTLLHLVCHAAEEHFYVNGPLTLADLSFLIDKQELNWPLFWSNAERIGALPQCALTFTLLETMWGPHPIEWPERHAHLLQLPDGLLDTAMRFMVCAKDNYGTVNLMADLRERRTIAGLVAVGLRRLVPPPSKVLASEGNSSERFTLWRSYMRHWRRILRYRLPHIFNVGNMDDFRKGLADKDQLVAWFKSGPTDRQSPENRTWP